MRAMEKDRTRRYSTASEFAADLRRYLENEPVLANPPTVGYRIQKFVRRNRVAVLAVSAVVVALVAGIVVSTTGLMRALRSEARALEAESTARKEAETAKQVSNLMVGLFEQATPWNGGSEITAREILDRSVKKLADDPTLEPLIRSRLMATYVGMPVIA